jgi:hypothetical protein
LGPCLLQTEKIFWVPFWGTRVSEEKNSLYPEDFSAQKLIRLRRKTLWVTGTVNPVTNTLKETTVYEEMLMAKICGYSP